MSEAREEVFLKTPRYDAKYYAKNRATISAKRKAKYAKKPISVKLREKRKLAMRKFRAKKKMCSIVLEIKKLNVVDKAVEKVRKIRKLHHLDKTIMQRLIALERRKRWQLCKKYLNEFKESNLLKVA